MLDAPSAPSRGGPVGRVRRIAGEWRLKLNRLAYSRDYFGMAGRALRLLLTGQFRAFFRKLFSERHVARPKPTANRSGPPLYLAGHIHRHGGYDHVVLKTLVGLLSAGINVFRDPRSCLNPNLVPDDFYPSERMYTWDG